MTKKELVAAIADRADVSVAVAAKVYDAAVEVLGDEIGNGGVRVDGFGTFKVNGRAARVAKNPRTGETINVPAKKVVGFKAAADLNAKVK